MLGAEGPVGRVVMGTLMQRSLCRGQPLGRSCCSGWASVTVWERGWQSEHSTADMLELLVGQPCQESEGQGAWA